MKLGVFLPGSGRAAVPEVLAVEHMALQFMVGRWPERKEKIERFGQEVLPALGAEPS